MGEWIEHDGSEWPKHAKPEDLVIIRFKDGVEAPFDTVKFWHGDCGEKGSCWYWDSGMHPTISNFSEISHYKVASDDPSKAS